MQKPHPPVWIPGGGSIETWQWCAKMDYVYAYLSYCGYKDGRATMHGFWDEMARLGKDRNPYRAGFLQFVGVAESRDKAMELYRAPAEYFYGCCLGHLMIFLQFDSMGKELAQYNTKLFSEKVMPRLCGLCSAWEDKW